jgi:hypothetical protein
MSAVLSAGKRVYVLYELEKRMKVVDLRALLPAVRFLKVQNHYPLTRKMNHHQPIAEIVADVLVDFIERIKTAPPVTLPNTPPSKP